MTIEFEAKVLEIDPKETSERILRSGGEKVGEFFMRRYVYEIAPGDRSKWIRLRDTGKEITLAIKEIHHDGIGGTEEIEITVNSFEDADRFLGKLGYRPKGYQENRRTSFLLSGAQLEIDEWPRIPPYLEIEGRSKEHVIQVALQLGIKEEQLTGESTIKTLARYGMGLDSLKDLRFEN